MSTTGPIGGPTGDAAPDTTPGGSRRPRGNARRGRIAAVAVSAGAVVALTTMIALNDGSASGTPASSSNSSSSNGSPSNQGNGNQGSDGFRPADPRDGFGFGGNDNSGNTGGSNSSGGFTPHTRSGGS